MKANQGKKLSPSATLFRDISHSISTMKDVYDLADTLLEDIEPIGGKAWVNKTKDNGGVLDPQLRARDVLEHWCRYSRKTPYGRNLYDALVSIVPRVAEDFQIDLLSEDLAWPSGHVKQDNTAVHMSSALDQKDVHTVRARHRHMHGHTPLGQVGLQSGTGYTNKKRNFLSLTKLLAVIGFFFFFFFHFLLFVFPVRRSSFSDL